MLNFPVTALSRPLEDFLKLVKAAPGQAMKMPIQLRWGGGLGASSQTIQVIAGWALTADSSRDLRLSRSFAESEKTRERFASTLPGMAALYFAEKIQCDDLSFSRFKALESVAPRIVAMQSGAFRDTLRGQGSALCCFMGAKNEYLGALYAKPSPGEVREVTDFQKLLSRILEQLSIRNDVLDEGQLSYLSGLLYQLFLNADEHGSYDSLGERFVTGMRGISARLLPITDVASLINVAGDDTSLKTYLLKQALRVIKPSEVLKPGIQVPFEPMQFLELSVFDTGLGLGLRWLAEKSGFTTYADFSIEQELEAVKTCFQKHATTKASQFKGQGLTSALMAMKKLDAFMALRTGRLSLVQDFSAAGTIDFAPKNRFTAQQKLAQIQGTSYSLCFRVK
jgi:hypothetical protein